ncbi:MAG: hypothetical protein KDD99_27115, partial [Bacteroidetes bacterium]|nr:hypothetical protein [Bacteroidota bacterium]
MINQTTTSLFRYFCFLSLILLISCKGNEGVTPEPPDPDPQPQQYGTPFAKVPATEDITMYEINLRVFSSSHNIQGAIA